MKMSAKFMLERKRWLFTSKYKQGDETQTSNETSIACKLCPSKVKMHFRALYRPYSLVVVSVIPRSINITMLEPRAIHTHGPKFLAECDLLTHVHIVQWHTCSSLRWSQRTQETVTNHLEHEYIQTKHDD